MDSRVAKALAQYDKRLACASQYLAPILPSAQGGRERIASVTKHIARGRTPTKASVDKYDRQAITEAWSNCCRTD
jgi:hypothetical protein